MKHFFVTILLFAACLVGVAQSGSESECYLFAPSMALEYQSKEVPLGAGQLSVTLKVKAFSALQFADSVSISTDRSGLTVAPLTVATRQMNPSDSLDVVLAISYNTASLPYYPVKITVTFYNTRADGKQEKDFRECFIYFTPYNTIEVWDIANYMALKRSWLIPSDSAMTRISVHPDSIPVSDIPANYQATDGEAFDMEFVPGLAYAVPMLYPEFQGYSPSGDSLAKNGCGKLWKRFKGRVDNLRVFTWHNRDRDGALVQIPLKNARVEIYQKISGPDVYIKTVYTDDQGFLSENSSRSIFFNTCASIDRSLIQIYLSIQMVDSNNGIRVKNVNDWYSWIRNETNSSGLPYNSDQAIHTPVMFGNANSNGTREIDLGQHVGGKLFTWSKWCKQNTNYELGSTAQLSQAIAIKIDHTANFVSKYNTSQIDILMAVADREDEFTMMHEFGHFVQHHLQNWGNINAGCQGRHSPGWNNCNPQLTMKEGFASGFAFIMDEMTRAATDGESGRGFGDYHERDEYISNLTHPFVAEFTLAKIMLDMWDGPVNFAAYNNNSATDDYNDRIGTVINDNFEMPFTNIMAPIYSGAVKVDVVQYYNALLRPNTTNCNFNSQLREIWYYNFSNTSIPGAPESFHLLNTDEITGNTVLNTPRFSDQTGPSTGVNSHTLYGTDISAFNSSVDSYNLTKYQRLEYNTAGQLISNYNVNAGGAVISDNLTVGGGTELLIHGSPRARWFNSSMPSLVTYNTLTSHLHTDICGQARITVENAGLLELGTSNQTTDVTIGAGSAVIIMPGATLTINTGSTLRIGAGGTLSIQGAAGLNLFGTIYVEAGGYICIDDALVNLQFNSNSLLHADAAAIIGTKPELGLTNQNCSAILTACVAITGTGISPAYQALRFDGINDRITPGAHTPATALKVNEGFTLEAFIVSDKEPVTCPSSSDIRDCYGQIIMMREYTQANDGFKFGILKDGRLFLEVKNTITLTQPYVWVSGTPSVNILADGPDLEDLNCRHVAVTCKFINGNSNNTVFSNAQVSFYVDGIPISGTTPPSATSFNYGQWSELGWSIGATTNTSNYLAFDGIIGELRIWNTPRSATDIEANVNGGLGNASPTQVNSSSGIGLMRFFDLQSGNTVVVDYSPEEIDGGMTPSNLHFRPVWVTNCDLPCTVQIDQDYPGNFRQASSSTSASESLLVTIAPNPFTSETLLSLSGPDGEVRVHITTLTGQTVFDLSNQEIGQSLTIGKEWASGIYVVRIIGAGHVNTLKIAKP